MPSHTIIIYHAIVCQHLKAQVYIKPSYHPFLIPQNLTEDSTSTITNTKTSYNNDFPYQQCLILPHYIESTNKPKTLHGVQISVDDWQHQSIFGMPNPDILPPTFVDEATGQTLQAIFEQPEDASFGKRTPTPSPPPTPKPKGKAKEVEDLHDDLMSNNIYEEEKPIPSLS
jgi:hypothetical protein